MKEGKEVYGRISVHLIEPIGALRLLRFRCMTDQRELVHPSRWSALHGVQDTSHSENMES
jgi:hypothetical protein